MLIIVVSCLYTTQRQRYNFFLTTANVFEKKFEIYKKYMQ